MDQRQLGIKALFQVAGNVHCAPGMHRAIDGNENMIEHGGELQIAKWESMLNGYFTLGLPERGDLDLNHAVPPTQAGRKRACAR